MLDVRGICFTGCLLGSAAFGVDLAGPPPPSPSRRRASAEATPELPGFGRPATDAEPPSTEVPPTCPLTCCSPIAAIFCSNG